MAKTLPLFPVVNSSLSKMVHFAVLQIFMVVMAIAERCTRAVPVQEYPAKKVHVLRRVPATCSNWDKAWAWLTKVDCGTKYRLDLVTVPSREIRQYKLQYVCCDGDTDCKEADNIQTPGFDSTDEKFLAIVLGSAAACVVIIIIIFAITFYTKKSRCNGLCDQESHVYASAEVDDTQDVPAEEKHQPEEMDCEKDYKGSEAEYAEISDPRLPRYTDIFKESTQQKEDPFNKASAPPMYSALNTTDYTNCEVVPSAPLNPVKEVEGCQKALPATAEGAGNQRMVNQNISPERNEDVAEIRYYNVREKKKRKKQSSSSQDESLNVNKDEGRIVRSNNSETRIVRSNNSETRIVRSNNNSETNIQNSSSRNKSSLPVSMEMMVKSSSASDGIGQVVRETCFKQNRRSAPPGSMDVAIGNIHIYPTSTRSDSVSSVSHSNSNICTVIHEPLPNPPQGGKKRSNSTSSREKIHQASTLKTTRGSDSKKLSFRSSSVSDDRTSTRSISPLKATLLTCEETSSKRRSLEELETTQPTEKDSLLQSSSCHSCCGEDSTFDNCEHCSKYDTLSHPPETDAESLHIYQCLDEVRKEVQELRAASDASSVETSLN